MGKININGDFYDEEKVIFKGKQSYKKRDRVLRIVGGILAGLGIVLVVYALCSDNPDYKTPMMIAVLGGMALVGAILLIVSFLPKDYIKAGTKIIEAEIVRKESEKKLPQKNQPAPTKPEVKEQVKPNNPPAKSTISQPMIKPDRVITINDRYKTKVQIKTDEMLFNFAQKEMQTRIYSPEDIVGCEIMVDDEEVFNSTNKNSKTTSSFKGKEIGEGISGIGSVISKFGGTAKVVGKGVTAAGTALKGANVERNATHNSVEERRGVVHKYTFIVRLNDLKFPSFVTRDISLEEIEDLGNTFAILLQHKQQAENITRSKTEVRHEIIDIPEEEPKEIPHEEPKVIEQKNNSYDKFEEIKKYKDLLDNGIITQEEFDAKKKELLGWYIVKTKKSCIICDSFLTTNESCIRFLLTNHLALINRIFCFQRNILQSKQTLN